MLLYRGSAKFDRDNWGLLRQVRSTVYRLALCIRKYAMGPTAMDVLQFGGAFRLILFCTVHFVLGLVMAIRPSRAKDLGMNRRECSL